MTVGGHSTRSSGRDRDASKSELRATSSDAPWDDHGPAALAVDISPGMVVQARVRTTLARSSGTWTNWAIALPGAAWEEHDEQAVWEEIDD